MSNLRYQPLHRPLVVKPRGVARVTPSANKGQKPRAAIVDQPAPGKHAADKAPKAQLQQPSHGHRRVGRAVGRACTIDHLLSVHAESSSVRTRPFLKRLLTRRVAAYAVAVLILVATGYVTVDTWLINRRITADTSVPTSAEVSQSNETAANASTGSAQFSEEIDTTKPATDILKNYTVDDDAPRALYITKLGVRARILSMGVASDGSIATPKNIYDSGWYNASAKPGSAGAMVIDGHASGATRVGLFAYLDKLSEGDNITVEKGDGTQLDYKVVHKDIVPKDEVNMQAFLRPYDGVSEGLNMMTCTGDWIEDQKTYDHRVLIYAKRV